MSKATIAQALNLIPNEGTGTPATGTPAQTFIIIGDRLPGEIIKIVFLSVEQSKTLPFIPPNALQIAVAPAGGL